MSNLHLIKANLLVVLREVEAQPHVGKLVDKLQSFNDQMQQLHEYLEIAGEYGIAYESLVRLLEQFPFQLSGRAAIKLLEAGLLLKYKTELPEDSPFDNRLPKSRG
jgi:hypothetical protein